MTAVVRKEEPWAALGLQEEDHPRQRGELASRWWWWRVVVCGVMETSVARAQRSGEQLASRLEDRAQFMEGQGWGWGLLEAGQDRTVLGRLC